MRNFPSVQTQVDFIAFGGGADKASSSYDLPPGMVLESKNYEPNSNGGYDRVKGYERFSGQAAPSDAVYLGIAGTLSAPPSAGTALTIGAATCKFVREVDGGLIVTAVVGTIPVSTNIVITGPTTIGATASDLDLPADITSAEDAQYLVESADVYRALINVPTGSGAIRGVCLYNGVVYCFRNNAGGTAGQMYKSTTSGWSLVSLGEEISFTNANTSVGDGDTLTQVVGADTVTATVARVVVETGTLVSGVNTGRLIITGRSSAPGVGVSYAAAAASTTGGGALTLSGAQTAITLPPSGKYTFDIYNFYGQTSSLRMYGANGVGKCFEFDGTVFVPLRTGAATDTPSFIKANRKYLYVGNGASLMNGSVGEPYRWVASEGATEFAIGDTITGIFSLPGEALGVMARNSSFALTGSSSADWVLAAIRGDVGAVPYTIAPMSDTFFLDDRGVMSVAAGQDYGNFSDATLSKRIQPTIDSLRSHVVGSYVSRQKSHYVLLMDDATTLVMGLRIGRAPSFMSGSLGFTPSCAFSGEDTTGIERIFVGGTDGHVYELDKGSTFDGAAIDSFVKIHFHSSKSPRVRKRYRKLVLEMTIAQYSAIEFVAEYSNGHSDIQPTRLKSFEAGGPSALWDVGVWDVSFWDSQGSPRPEFSMNGTGLNVALLFGNSTKLDFGHSLKSALIHYTPRRLQR